MMGSVSSLNHFQEEKIARIVYDFICLGPIYYIYLIIGIFKPKIKI